MPAMAMHFDLVDLRLMVHIADANSMTTRGAELSFISRPPPARASRTWESIHQLLYRTSQGVTLTPSGQAFMTHARMVLSQIEHLRGDICRNMCAASRAVMRVCQHHSSGEFLPPVLRHFCASAGREHRSARAPVARHRARA